MSSFEASRTGRRDFDIQDGPDFRAMPEHSSRGSHPEGDMVLVMSYVKQQTWGEVLDCDAGLSRGTIFPELEKPFLGQGGCEK